MSSRPTSPLHLDHAQRLAEFIDSLTTEQESVASELDVLRSIYGDQAIRIWYPSSDPANAIIRYEIDTNLPAHENIHIQVLVSLTTSYPASSPPQLQLLSRYIGAFSVSPELFGKVLKTFISLHPPVQFTPHTVVVFDGLQHVVEMCSAWYAERLEADMGGKLVREDPNIHPSIPDLKSSLGTSQDHIAPPPKIPVNLELFEAEAIVDRKSVFIGRACRITHPSQVPPILSFLMTDRRIARAVHPVINAWRCKVDGMMHQDNDDDGETAAGGRLAHLLQILELDGVLVVVTRFFGGINLGPDRFKHINQAARSALEKGHFLDADEKIKNNSRGKKRLR